MASQKRLTYIDIAKGIAIFLVVIGHILQFNFSGTSKDALFNWIYSFHMPIFMMLSGYVSSYKYEYTTNSLLLQQIKKKINQLLVPFFIWGGILMPMIKNYDICDYWSNFINLIISPHTGAWFLLSLFFIHLYVIIGLNISKRLRFKRIYSDLIGTFIILIIIFIIEKYLVLSTFDDSFYFPVKYYIMYVFGYFLSKYYNKLTFSPIIFAVSFIIFSIFVYKYNFATSSSFLQLLISIPASIILLNLSVFFENSQITNKKDSLDKLTNYLTLLGHNSLVIYLVHIPLIFFVNNNLIISNYITPLFLFICCIIPAILICNICITIGNLCKCYPSINKLIFGK